MTGMTVGRPSSVQVRQARLTDVAPLQQLERLCFPRIPDDRHWKVEQLQAHVTRFPEGQFVAEIGGELAGDALNLRVRWSDALKPHSWTSITGGGLLTTHVPDGDVLYGTEVMVHPRYRRRGIGRRLYEERKAYVRAHRMRAFVAGGRIPGFERYAEHMDVREYVGRVMGGEIVDRVLTPQLRSGLTVVEILEKYIHDPPSLNFATLLVWWPKPALRAVGGTLDENGFDL